MRFASSLGQLLVLSLSLVLGAGCATTQPATSSPTSALEVAPQQVAQPATGRHALWEATGDSGGTAYLLGSVHLQRAGAPALPEVIETAFAEADVVVFELDLDEIYDDPLGILDLAFFQDERTLQSELSQETWARVVEHVGDPAVLLTLAKAKPWFLALTLSIGELQTEGYSAEAGLDVLLFQRAKEAGKERIALETAAEQLGFFDSFSPEEQDMFLLQVLEETGGTETAEQADQIVGLWEEGDTEGLEAIFAEESEEFPGLYEKLLGERNRRWIPRIEELMREHDAVLVVVGVAHLVGDDSVVELLREAGYEVRQR